jgi:hypothetical protein
MFEANGSAAATLARIDAANRPVAGKQVTALIVTIITSTTRACARRVARARCDRIRATKPSSAR